MQMKHLLVVASMAFAVPCAHADHAVSDISRQCRANEQQFATCGEEQQAYKSVTVAIHGWGGHCSSTFGDGQQTLFKHLLLKGVSDIDCFEYSTKGMSAEGSAIKLRQRLDVLGKSGYRDFQFVTHSMGGVVFLRMLLDDFLSDDGKSLRGADDPKRFFKPQGPRMAMASIWASPINGVKLSTELALQSAEMFKLIPEHSRNALAPDSTFVAKLHADMVMLAKLLEQSSDEVRGEYPFRLNFHHGMGDDWVVRPIGKNDIWHKDFKDTRLTIDVSSTGHSGNVGDPGDVKLARFPVTIIKSEQVLGLNFLPRIETAFPSGDDGKSGRYNSRRERIVNGAVRFVGMNFEKAVFRIRDLVERVVADGYVHVAQHDEALFDGLLGVVTEKASEISGNPDSQESFLIFADAFLCNGALEKFRADGSGADRLGSDRYVAVNKLIRLMTLLAEKASEIELVRPDLKSRWSNCGSGAVAVKTAAAAQIDALRSPHDKNWQTALINLKQLMKYTNARALDDLAFANALVDFRLRKSAGLSEVAAVDTGDLLVAATAKSEQQRQIALTRLALPSSSGGAPVFTQVLKDYQLKALNKQIDTASAKSSETDFVIEVLNFGGGTSGDETVALDAGSILHESIRLKPVSEQKQIIERIDLGKLRTRWPHNSSRIGRQLQQYQEP